MAFILFDTETTGSGDNDRICQIALGIMDGGDTKYICEYCNPPIPISFHAMAVHGITSEKIATKPPFEKLESAQILSKLNNKEHIVIAHNAKFDIDMLKKEGVEWGGGVIDTLRVAKHLLPDEESHALQYLRYALSIYKEEGDDEEMDLRARFDTFSAHDALFDIYILKKLFKRLFVLAGSSTRMVELTKAPIIVKKLKFGKYKGLTIEEIAKKDKNYLNWLSQNNDDEDLKYSIELYLSR